MEDHIKKAVRAAEEKFPYARLVFLLDNSPNHKKFSDDALNVTKMNVKPGGKQPKMHNTHWGPNKTFQSMVDDKGKPKGLKKVLEERGVNTTGFKLNHPDLRKDYRKRLSEFDDFQNEKPILQQI